MSKTTYADIAGFPGYRVGDDGTIWRRWVTCRSGRKLTDRWRPMRLATTSRGYRRVNLVPPEGGTYRTVRVHHLVLIAFVGPRPAGAECRHLNGLKADNRLANLAWGTPEENRGDNHEAGVYGRGESHTQATLTDDAVRAIRFRREAGESLKSLAAAFNTSQATISMIANRRIWKHVA